jgi:hypothetical protein
MEEKGLNHKEVYYGIRHKDVRNGSYFTYSCEKTVCNPNERHKFYLKIGGIVYAPSKKVEGRKKSMIQEKIKESDYFGSYLVYSGADRKLRAITYCRKRGWPQQKLVSGLSMINSVIPRIEGRRGHLIIGLSIDGSENISARRWTLYDKAKSQHYGISEIPEYYSLINTLPRAHRSHKLVGIYVSQNTSLLMIDETEMSHIYNDLFKYRNYTVVQEGGFLLIEAEFFCKFLDIEESKVFSLQELYANKANYFSSTQHFGNICRSNPVIILKSAPNFTFWTLRISEKNDNFIRTVQLCIPTGGQFEEVFDWNSGIEEVMRRQSLKPWNKYIEEDTRKSRFMDIDPDVSEPYPEFNSDE